MPTQGVRDEIEGPPEVRVSEVSLPVLENTQISNEVKTSIVTVSDFGNIAVNDMNKDIVESQNVENVDVHELCSEGDSMCSGD